jgi:hypothetical protein
MAGDVVAAVMTLAAAVVVLAGLVRWNFIVVDRHVLWWQVAPILERGTVRNGREYRAVQYYLEQVFERGGFAAEKPLADSLNALLAGYHAKIKG